jgi:ketosteroid isomerase-like protein
VQAAQSTLINRDREFSNASATQGIPKAFMMYSADEVTLFRNDNYPVIGREASLKALLSKTQSNSILTWQPLAGDVSSSDDLGYTHGTYTLTTSQESRKITERGNYVRFWKKQNGLWKVRLDIATPFPPDTKN